MKIDVTEDQRQQLAEALRTAARFCSEAIADLNGMPMPAKAALAAHNELAKQHEEIGVLLHLVMAAKEEA